MVTSRKLQLAAKMTEKKDKTGVSEYLVRLDILAIWRWLKNKWRKQT
jgi:hypothetical protein